MSFVVATFALSATSLLGGASAKARANRQRRKSLQRGIKDIQGGLSSAALTTQKGIENVWEGVGNTLDTILFKTGDDLSKIQKSSEGMMKAQKGLATGEPSQIIEEQTKSLQETLNATYEDVLTKSEFEIEKIGGEHEETAVEADTAMKDMAAEAKSLKGQGKWYQNIF